MKVVTASEMREIDEKTIEEYGLSGDVLMERAGAAVAQKVKELFSPKKTIVLAGQGNNGGDGVVVARELYNSGWNAKLIVLFDEDKLSPDCAGRLKTARKFGVPVEFRSSIDEKDTHGAIIVDAIFGTGLKKPVTGAVAGVIDFLNKSGSPVVSVDIPSGISSDTGEALGRAIKADHTVTFGLPKRGHYLHPGAGHTGALHVTGIGFPKQLLESESISCRTVEKEDIVIPERPAYSHKGDYGHVLLVAGSKGKTGAALMAAKSCLRAGAGLVTLAVPESLMTVFQARVTEEMTLSLPETKGGGLSPKAADRILKFIEEKADVLAIGPGIGVSKETGRLVAEVLMNSDVPAVIDADAISVLKKADLKKAKAPFVLTPHPGEMARLLGVKPTDIERDRIGSAYSFMKDFPRSALVLKGAPTVTSGGGGVWINTTGNPGMAKAGTGDVLTGMIAALLAQKLSPLASGITGAYLHGLCGDIAASEGVRPPARKGLHSVLASDLIETLPAAFIKEALA